MANPLDIVTQDQRLDDNGNPLRRVYITGSDVAPVDNGDAFQPPSNRLTQAVAPPQDDILSLIAQVKDYLTNPTGFSAGTKIGNRLTGSNGEERYQTWPERMVRSGLTLPGDVASGAEPMLPPGLRREDFTDKPAPDGLTVAAQPGDTVRERAMDTAGLAGGSTLFAKPGSGTLGSGAMRPGPKAMPAAEAPIFYSALEHAATNAAQDVMTGPQWAGYLKNQPGVKGEELAWTGLPEWLAEQKGKVSKEDVQRYLDEHKVEIKDVTKGRGAQHGLDEGRFSIEELPSASGPSHAIMDNHQNAVVDRFPTRQEAEDALTRYADDPEFREQYGDTTKYSSYQLPGGENYREHLLTLPPRVPGPSAELLARHEATGAAMDKVVQTLTDKYKPKRGETLSSVKDKMSPEDRQAYSEALRARDQTTTEMAEATGAGTRGAEKNNLYKSSHWDEPNVLAHVRTNDRDVGGVPSLHLEEIQSDWHQQGRKKGYQDGAPGTLYLNGKVPDAPFKTSWPELALKRMIRMAAEEDKTRISWTPGEAQAARYDLSKQIKTLQFQKNIDGTYNLWGNTTAGGNHRFGQDIPADKLADYVGKDVASRIVDPKLKIESHTDPKIPNVKFKLVDEAGNIKSLAENQKQAEQQVEAFKNTGQLKDADLKVGGEGMKGFYDNMLPKMVEKLGKAHGVKVQKGTLPSDNIRKTVDDRYTVVGDKRIFDTRAEAEAVADHPVHYFDIPEAWRDQALRKGFPLYMSGLPFPLTPVDHDPFKKEK